MLSGTQILEGLDILSKKKEQYEYKENDVEPLKVTILVGGTAGYLSAISFKKHVKNLEVNVIDFVKVPPIMVGEATVDTIIPFLHNFLGIDVHGFYKKVQPTWKFGIRFEW